MISLLSTAAAYAVTGYLGLLLAIPPGYASPVFPAAGLALALVLVHGYRLLPGIWAGSLILNLYVAWSQGALTPNGATIALLIGVGAMLQAGVGAWLIRKAVENRWQDLLRERDTFKFLILGGPLACLISATVANLTLSLAGVVPFSEIPWSWWNWWAGDTLGVLVFSPLLLSLFSDRPHWKVRRILIVPVMLLLVALITIGFVGTSSLENRQRAAQIAGTAQGIAFRLQERFNAYNETLSALRRLIEVSSDMNDRQFEHFTRSMLEDYPGVAAFSFNTLVRENERLEFERTLSAEGPVTPFRITERNQLGELTAAGKRPEHVVVTYIAPLSENLRAVGYDIYSNPIRAQAIDRARRTAKPAATAAIQLVQDRRKKAGILVLHPAYRQPFDNRAAENPPHLIGFAVGVLKVPDIVHAAIGDTLEPGIVFQLTDSEGESVPRPLFHSASDTEAAVAGLEWNGTLTIADRVWNLRVYPDGHWLRTHRAWQAWTIGIVGLLVASMLQLILLTITGRTLLIQRTVDERTADLHAKTEALREAKETAEESTRAKSEFLANISHELRTPLHAIISFTSLAREKVGKAPDEKIHHYLKRIRESGERLLALINDLLDISKLEAGKLELSMEEHDLRQSVLEVRDELAEILDKHRQRLEIHAPNAPATAHCDPLRISQVVRNLVSNAIKFSPPETVITVTVKESVLGDGRAAWATTVSDQGVGVPADELERIFDKFVQSSKTNSGTGGTGLGLAICKEIVERHGGWIEAENNPRSGISFTFTVPAAQ